MNVISLFSGAGGMDLGLEMAGMQTRLCIEIDTDARATLALNRPHWQPTHAHGGDITSFTSDEILELAGLAACDVDVIAGGPPCQSFSNLGRKGGLRDARGSLILHYLRIVEDIRPRFCLFENVEGLLQHKQAIHELRSRFEAMGYIFALKLVNAADFGVPQVRRRVIGIGVRDLQFAPFPFETHARHAVPARRLKKWVSIDKAFAALPKEYKQRADNMGMRHAPYMVRRIAKIGVGENFRALPARDLPACWRNGRHQGVDTFGRLDPSKPSVTIRTSGFNPTKGRYIHPYEDRGLTTLEMACLQSFPFEWRFVGKIGSVGRQIGNAVPPLLARRIGEALMDPAHADRIEEHVLKLFSAA